MHHLQSCQRCCNYNKVTIKDTRYLSISKKKILQFLFQILMNAVYLPTENATIFARTLLGVIGASASQDTI